MDYNQYAIPTDEVAFEEIYISHFKGMYSYAFTILKDEIDAEEIVQSIFVKLWEKKEILQVKSSLKSYIYRMVHNDCMNLLKHKIVNAKFVKEKIYAMKNENETTDKKVLVAELEQKLSVALRQLPEQCRTIFQLSRFECL